MYDPSQIEPKWQEYWLKNKTFSAISGSTSGGKAELNKKKEKYYVLDMFPYPSGAGLHVGHPEGYTATDIICRYKRMKGFNVLHPMGWDAFGLPAENYAIKTGRHPREVTEENIKTFKKQIQSIGFSYDWDREVDTTDPNYYKWTQWIFLQLFKKGLAYEDELPINWCPSCMTGLANEEVVDSKCDRCGHETTKKMLRQWVLKITDYADRLLEDLKDLDWPEPIKTQQRNWIGKSYGANVTFDTRKSNIPPRRAGENRKNSKIQNSKHKIEVYTTRPDTLFGATYMVLSPEHPLVYELVTDEYKAAVEKYKEFALMKSDLERTDLNKDKTGEFIGAYAINPVNGEEIPIWIADYVLMGCGTGAVMAVPGHDERDWEFAKKFDLKIAPVIKPTEDSYQQCRGALYKSVNGKMIKVWEEPLSQSIEDVIDGEICWKWDGEVINSDFLNGMDVEKAKYEMIRWLEEKGIGDGAVNYKLKDWVFSRQRYWGEPIPIINCEKCGPVPLEESDLPLLLPDVKNYQPTGTGESPLASITDWVEVNCPKCKGPARRETNTMPQWAGSCWYYLRYLSPTDDKHFANPDEEKYWMNVDLYVGGAEHAVLHLLYARFWHKVLFDLGYVKDKEPFQKLMNQGLILGEDNEKMSKSRGNVVNPDDVIRKYGADTLRLYEMFMGPFEAVKPWSTKNIEGSFRFLQKVFNYCESWKENYDKDMSDNPKDNEKLYAGELLNGKLKKLLHKTIKKVTEDIENFGFNTAISALMIFINEVKKESKQTGWSVESNMSISELGTYIKLVSPFAPHLAEEAWEMLGNKESIAYEPWPTFDPKLVVDDTFELVFAVNGKKRGSKEVPLTISEEGAIQFALEDEGVLRNVEGKEVVKRIYVPKKLVNIVVK